MTTHLNCLVKAVQMRGHNICFNVDIMEVIPILAKIISNYHQLLCFIRTTVIGILIIVFCDTGMLMYTLICQYSQNIFIL